jgi:threonine/homoserine/homoserine lactone efflux protein
MTLETWLSYVIAYTVLSLIPGPSVFMVLGQSLSRGIGAALYCRVAWGLLFIVSSVTCLEVSSL